MHRRCGFLKYAFARLLAFFPVVGGLFTLAYVIGFGSEEPIIFLPVIALLMFVHSYFKYDSLPAGVSYEKGKLRIEDQSGEVYEVAEYGIRGFLWLKGVFFIRRGELLTVPSEAFPTVDWGGTGVKSPTKADS